MLACYLYYDITVFCCHQTRFLGSKYHTHAFVPPDSLAGWGGKGEGRPGKGREREEEGGGREKGGE